LSRRFLYRAYGAKKYNLPLVILENGTAENTEALYGEYLVSHLKQMERAIAAGVDTGIFMVVAFGLILSGIRATSLVWLNRGRL